MFLDFKFNFKHYLQFKLNKNYIRLFFFIFLMCYKLFILIDQGIQKFLATWPFSLFPFSLQAQNFEKQTKSKKIKFLFHIYLSQILIHKWNL